MSTIPFKPIGFLHTVVHAIVLLFGVDGVERGIEQNAQQIAIPRVVICLGQSCLRLPSLYRGRSPQCLPSWFAWRPRKAEKINCLHNDLIQSSTANSSLHCNGCSMFLWHAAHRCRDVCVAFGFKKIPVSEGIGEVRLKGAPVPPGARVCHGVAATYLQIYVGASRGCSLSGSTGRVPLPLADQIRAAFWGSPVDSHFLR